MNKTSEEILTEEIKYLRTILQRKEQALAILEGNSGTFNGELQTSSPISLNALYEYPKKAPTKRKVIAILKLQGTLVRKSEIINIYMTKEGIRATEENINQTTMEITNALSNLRTAKKVMNYKPEKVKMKGGFWGLSEFFEGENKPIEKYKPDLSNINEDE